MCTEKKDRQYHKFVVIGGTVSCRYDKSSQFDRFVVTTTYGATNHDKFVILTSFLANLSSPIWQLVAPANTQRNKHVIITSKCRFYVMIMLYYILCLHGATNDTETERSTGWLPWKASTYPVTIRAARRLFRFCWRQSRHHDNSLF